MSVCVSVDAACILENSYTLLTKLAKFPDSGHRLKDETVTLCAVGTKDDLVACRKWSQVYASGRSLIWGPDVHFQTVSFEQKRNGHV